MQGPNGALQRNHRRRQTLFLTLPSMCHSLTRAFIYLLTYLLTCVAVKRLTSKGTTFTRRDESEMTAVSHVTSPSLYFLLYFVYFRIFSFIFVHFRFFSFIMPRAATL